MIQTKDLGYNNTFWQSGLAFCFAVIVLMLVIGSGVSAFSGGFGNPETHTRSQPPDDLNDRRYSLNRIMF